MFRRFFAVLCVFLGISSAHAGQAANIEYVHNAVREKWGVELTSASSPNMVANMEYLMAAVDVVNEHLNGHPVKKTEWKKYATRQVADTIATDFVISELIGVDWPFEISTTEMLVGDVFEFALGAAGTFYVDWGDGMVEKIERDNTEIGIYDHTYETDGTYKIKFRGRATGYSKMYAEGFLNGDEEPAISISFSGNPFVAGISGSLGAIFSTLPDGTNPSFMYLFEFCENLTGEIPADLFSGVYGEPVTVMFLGAFSDCPGLTGNIPENLFDGISGAPTTGLFAGTFYGCSGLTGNIPEKLFDGISGAPTTGLFESTFNGCSSLTGTIPENLFAGISGAPAEFMYVSTFQECSGLTGVIPSNLFAGIAGAPAELMFVSTFEGATGLSGIGGPLFAGVSGAPASGMYAEVFENCINLSGAIPDGMFGELVGAVQSDMFSQTFKGCSGLTGSIPENLFGHLSGDAMNYMFKETFYGCAGLTGSSAKNDGKYLYEIWQDATETQVGNMYKGCTRLDDYYRNCDGVGIPKNWGGAASLSYCGEYPFSLTTIDGTEYFSFDLGHKKGNVYVDWGDGHQDVYAGGENVVAHEYDKPGKYTISLASNLASLLDSDLRYTKLYDCVVDNYATTSVGVACSQGQNTISFEKSAEKIAAISGSLGDVFPVRKTTGSGGAATDMYPTFRNLFKGAVNMTGEIPQNLFDGAFVVVRWRPMEHVFEYAFADCSGLTGTQLLLDGRASYGYLWPDSSPHMYQGCTGLSDYEQIYSGWK